MKEKFDRHEGSSAEQDAEVLEEVKILDQKAGEVGGEINNLDLEKIKPTDALKLNAKIKMILGGYLTLAAGLATPIVMDVALQNNNPEELEIMSRTFVGALGVGTATASLYGFKTFIEGCRNFLGYVKKTN